MLSDSTRFLRASGRLLALSWVALTSAAAFIALPAHRCDLFSRGRWLQCVCRRAVRALGIDCRSFGRPPRGRLVLANHLSYVDILVLAAAAPTVFVAKREVRAWPVFGWFARAAGTRFLDRNRRSDVARVAAELVPALAAGVNVVLFLEGTSTDGTTVLPFKTSLLEPAARNAWAAVPAALAYRIPPRNSAAHDVCWWGDMTLLPHLWKLAGIPRITALTAWGLPLAPASDRKELARAAHTAVQSLHSSLINASEPVTEGSTPILAEQII
jgi:1-acyl-sn-glycerol-3-phosphate acyltransferase